MLVVVLLMMIMMGMAVFAFVDLGRGAKLRAAVLEFRGAIAHARQYAITYRVPTFLRYGNVAPPGTPPGTPPNRGYYVVSTGTVSAVIGITNFLHEGLLVSNVPPVTSWVFRFKPDGSCVSDGDGLSGTVDWEFDVERHLKLWEVGRGVSSLSSTLRVIRATGSVIRKND